MTWASVPAKYRSKKTTIDGITFDSKKEATRYKELRIMERAGLISGLRLQVAYELIPAQYAPPAKGRKKGKLIERPCTYKADFVYMCDGKKVVEDVKGLKTKEYIIKRKLMLFRYGIRILET